MEPDFTVCGTPLVEFLDKGRLDEHVERAAKIAADNPAVAITVCLFHGETLLKEFRTWAAKQRPLLRAWRVENVQAAGKLALRTHTIVRPGENIITAAFVQFTPASRKA